MFGWGRKDGDADDIAAKKKRTASTPSKKSRLGSGRQKGASASASLVSRRRPRLGKKNKSLLNVADGAEDEDVDFTTVASSVGIEVALSSNDMDADAAAAITPNLKQKANVKPPTSPKKTVVSFQRELISREKVNRGQFNVNNWPALGGKKNSTDKNTTPPVVGAPPNAKTGKHRVQLPGAENERKKDELSYEEMLLLLKSSEAFDEAISIEMEIKHLSAEVEALKEDRAHLEAMSLQIPEDPQTKAADWEKHRLLA
eukprot:scaffold45848_cov199-Amphora_coffeaeformis.AAC.1